MEELLINNHPSKKTEEDEKYFITANTIQSSLEEIKRSHLIPVFIKDNEPLISQSEFIEGVVAVASDVFDSKAILKPNVRVSHPVKGRIPEARHKSADQLLEAEKTLYFERMAFILEIPSVSTEIEGNHLSLTIGGVKAYNLDNLYSKKGAEEHFKLFIGFKNRVCTNLCVWSDGLMEDLRVISLGQLKAGIQTLISNYNQTYHLNSLEKLVNYRLTEKQFAQLLGRCRLYQHLWKEDKAKAGQLLLNDTQLNSVAKGYYQDNSFGRQPDGSINLWRLYNLFTGANKTSYIDNFLERSVNNFRMVEEIRFHLDKKEKSWFLN